MSHTAETRTEMTNQAAILAACKRLELAAPTHREVRFYDGRTVTGLAIELPRWQYPVVVCDDGQLVYDDFKGMWGDVKRLDELAAAYSAEVFREQAKVNGWQYAEQVTDGEIQVTIGIPETY